MENIIINPENFQENYLDFLNVCFPNWGTEKDYEWVFERIVGDKKSDIMIINDDQNNILAGSGISYRKLRKEDEKKIDIGIMTGSWTLPIARGKGCFTKIIDISKKICEQRNVHFLTAFVMESNPSFRRLKEAGSHLIPTYHFKSKDSNNEGKFETSVIKVNSQLRSEIYYKFIETGKGYLNFSYSEDEFYGQYMNSSRNIEILKVGSDYAILEETQNIIKVLFVTHNSLEIYEQNIISINSWAKKERSKNLLLFTTINDKAKVLNVLGYEKLPGYFTILVTDSMSKRVINFEKEFKDININLGDKM